MTDLLTKYTTAMHVLDEMREGYTLTQACKRQHTSRRVIIGMMGKDATLQKMVSEAAIESEDMMADLLVNIDQHHPDPKMAKVISDNIKWLLARRRGADYGDRMVVESRNTSQDEAIISALREAIGRIPIPEKPIEDIIDVTPEPDPNLVPIEGPG